MTADDVTTKLAALFPFHFGDQQRAEARLELYGSALASVAGPRLAEAYRRTMATWKDKNPPLPAHILENLPPLEAGTKTPDDGAMADHEVEAVMADLVTSSLGQEIVAEDLAHQLEDMVRQRSITHIGQLSRDLIAKLKANRAKFEASFQRIDPAGPLAGQLRDMGEKLRVKAQRRNAKWAAFLRSKQGAA